jgi:hypothetical protein
VTEALETAPADDLAARIRAVARGYRGFASEDAQRFSLLFGLPAPGYASHSDSGAVHANVAVMRAFEKLVPADVAPGQLQPLVRAVGRALAEDIERAQGPRIPPDVYQSLLHLLAAIHGFAALETFGHLNWISERARDELFEAQISLHTHAMAAFALGR